MKHFRQQEAVFDDPSINSRMVKLDPAFFHEFFDMTSAEGVRQIPANAHENDLFGKMRSLETARHRRSPSYYTVTHRGT
jgi:hypothetical protein